MKKQELIEMLKASIEQSESLTKLLGNRKYVTMSKSDATDLLRELEGEAPTCKCGNKKVLQYACKRCDN